MGKNETFHSLKFIHEKVYERASQMIDNDDNNR